ncbi:prepilin-type N-terminal cleavage/methylation domain-containing protein [Castellaniella sp.]|uniref:prepilin-type N-terminal cleavage/methylation domain-containing protein n=1 Tax=Castellaniella sp. TaxID=1955812 RepID=UPI002AFFAF90|nr:prepilin-type N-terminal cleavage/methylation domain-containing protein [Castellaniella sp.]
MKALHSAQRGLTLIEVLVALVLLALLSLIAWRGLDAVSGATERLGAQARETQSLMQVFGQLERDLQLQAGPDVLLAWALVSDRPSARIQLLPRTPGMSWDQVDGLRLVRAAGGGQWQQIHWFYTQGGLFRAAGQPGYGLPLPAPGAPVQLLDQVTAWSLRVWVPGRGWTEPDRLRVAAAAPAGTAPVRGTSQDEGLVGLEFSMLQGRDDSALPYRSVVLLP